MVAWSTSAGGSVVSSSRAEATCSSGGALLAGPSSSASRRLSGYHRRAPLWRWTRLTRGTSRMDSGDDGAPVTCRCRADPISPPPCAARARSSSPPLAASMSVARRPNLRHYGDMRVPARAAFPAQGTMAGLPVCAPQSRWHRGRREVGARSSPCSARRRRGLRGSLRFIGSRASGCESTLPACGAGFGRRELVGLASAMGCKSALASDFSEARRRHARKAALAARSPFGVRCAALGGHEDMVLPYLGTRSS
jgi:hypothetical protein